MRGMFLVCGAGLLLMFWGLRAQAESDDRIGESAPELVAGDWLNSKPLTLKEQKGKIVVVHFWTNGCINCIHNYPCYRDWVKRFKDKDVVIVGIHTPEFDSEKNLQRIKDRVKKNELSFPILLDNDSKNWRAWDNHYWPAIYVIDKAGKIVAVWEGELNKESHKKMTPKIESLLAK